MCALRRSAHAVYECYYHFAWATKYRKQVLDKTLQDFISGVLYDIAEHYEFAIQELEFGKEHLHILVAVPPRYAPAEVAQILKGASSRIIFQQFPKIRKQYYWGGEFWIDGYMVKTIGSGLTLQNIKEYIYHHRKETLFPKHKPRLLRRGH